MILLDKICKWDLEMINKIGDLSLNKAQNRLFFNDIPDNLEKKNSVTSASQCGEW